MALLHRNICMYIYIYKLFITALITTAITAATTTATASASATPAFERYLYSNAYTTSATPASSLLDPGVMLPYEDPDSTTNNGMSTRRRSSAIVDQVPTMELCFLFFHDVKTVPSYCIANKSMPSFFRIATIESGVSFLHDETTI